jgi:peptidoglycan-N-acetylglucosamine deacetylase
MLGIRQMTTITLSFDNGPDPEVTPLVLETLRNHDIRSSFFVLGDKLRDRRRLSEMVHAEGHWIGNHTYNHIVPLGSSVESGFAAAEIRRTQELIGDLAHDRKFFRPYGGGGIIDRRLLNAEALHHLEIEGFTCVLWNVIPQDWVYPEGWVERALEMSFARQHALIVLHDLPTGAMNKLDQFIHAAKDRGASFEQDFPISCTPIERGKIVGPIDELITVPS